jgi:hypothetical protein
MKVLAILFGAALILVAMALGSVFYSLMAMEIQQPAVMTVVTVLLYGAIAWFAVAALRRPQPPAPIVSGILIGAVIGSLLCGLCSTMMAINSGAGLNFH